MATAGSAKPFYVGSNPIFLSNLTHYYYLYTGTPAGTDWVYPCRDNDHLAHLVEHRAFNLQVLGSNPRVITK